MVDLSFKDFIEKIGDFGKTEWLTVYSNTNYDKEDSPCFYCALLPQSRIKKALSDQSWDMSIGDGLPGFEFVFQDGKEIGTYARFSSSGIEPLVISRSFHGMKPDYREISEEFRLYFNLYCDVRKGKYLFIDENGDDEVVIIMEENEIKIKLRLIKEFLSAKNMQLALYFDITRHSSKSLSENGLKPENEVISGEDYIYSRWLDNYENFGTRAKWKTVSLLMGKKIIGGLKDFQPKLIARNKEYTEYAIGVDENGKERLFTCNEEHLANYFGKNPDSPHYLTPILFKRDVMLKYYSQPSKYIINDGHLTCGGMWSLPIDNNHSEYISVFLGDLGKLEHKEQLYWKGFNVAGKGTVSHVAWERAFMGEFANPEKSDLYFKQKFSSFKKKWQEEKGWDLFLPLSEADEHCLSTLRIPLTNEQKEFDEQVLSITKIMIDSLNEKELSKGLTLDTAAKGLDKLEAFFTFKNISFEEMMIFLRSLQNLRSACVAHRKGKQYEKIKKYFNIGEKDLPEVLDDILIKCIWVLNTLESEWFPKTVL